jgi:hypothetical protein
MCKEMKVMNVLRDRSYKFGMKAMAMLFVLSWVPKMAAVSPAHQIDVVHAIRRVREISGPNEKTAAAEHLRDIVLTTRASDIDDQTIHAMASLLSIRLGSVSYWVTEALGHFGPRANFVAPKLRRILAESECVISETSSEDMIRDTLERIGSPAPPKKCDRYILPK